MKKLLITLLLTGSMYGAVTMEEFIRLCAKTPIYVPAAGSSCYTVAELYTKILTPTQGYNHYMTHDLCFKLCTNPSKLYETLDKLYRKDME